MKRVEKTLFRVTWRENDNGYRHIECSVLASSTAEAIDFVRESYRVEKGEFSVNILAKDIPPFLVV